MIGKIFTLLRSTTHHLRKTLRNRRAREMLIYSEPFGLSLSKPLKIRGLPFDKLRANGINQCLPRNVSSGCKFSDCKWSQLNLLIYRVFNNIILTFGIDVWIICSVKPDINVGNGLSIFQSTPGMAG